MAYQRISSRKLRSTAATSSSSAMLSTPPFTARPTMARPSSTREKRGEPFFKSRLVTSSVSCKRRRTSSGVSPGCSLSSSAPASGHVTPSAARARILSNSSAFKSFSCIISSHHESIVSKNSCVLKGLSRHCITYACATPPSRRQLSSEREKRNRSRPSHKTIWRSALSGRLVEIRLQPAARRAFGAQQPARVHVEVKRAALVFHHSPRRRRSTA